MPCLSVCHVPGQLDDAQRLARAALAGRVNDQLVDLSFVIREDSDLAIITDKNFKFLKFDEVIKFVFHIKRKFINPLVIEIFENAN